MRSTSPVVLAPVVLAFGLALAASPAAAYNLYYGNMHSHCALSDGIGTPDEAFTHARDVANIDVLVLTDHTHLLSASEYNTLLAKATQYSQNGVFLAIGAQEFGNLNDFNHMNIYDAPSRNPVGTDDLFGAYSFILSQGAFASFNHPNPIYGTNFNNLTFYPQYSEAMRAIEVVNGRASEDYEVQYLQALAAGWKVGPFGNQDNHEGMWGDQQNTGMGGDIYLTGIWADGLTRADIMAALRARRFYAMEVDPPSDRLEVMFAVDGNPMGSVVTTGGGPTFTVSAHAVNGSGLFNRIEIFRDGVLAHQKVIVGNTVNDTWQDFLADGESHYYFAKVQQVDQDRAWTAPVWVTAHIAPSDAPLLEPVVNDMRLLPSQPSPMAPNSELRFVLPPRVGTDPYHIRITIHDVNGRLVRDLGTRPLSGGEHQWQWDGNDDQGRSAPSGVYLYRVHGEDLPERSARLVLLR